MTRKGSASQLALGEVDEEQGTSKGRERECSARGTLGGGGKCTFECWMSES